MRDVLPRIEAWHRGGEAVALATVVATWGSSPRPAGSAMAIAAGGGIAGSVSGGCVESAVAEAARASLLDGRSRRLTFGVADPDAWAVGLSCGGTIEVLVTPLDRDDPAIAAWGAALAAERAVAVATVLSDPGSGRRMLVAAGAPEPVGGLGDAALDDAARAALRRALAEEAAPATVTLAAGGAELEVFVAVYAPRPRLVLVGAVHVAEPLVGFAHALGFRTVVIDPRRAFATRARFPDVETLVHDWPDVALRELGLDRHTYLATLSHDPKLDLPALRLGLASPARYLGALGSRRTHERRLATLRDEGFDDAALGRIHAPIGLDLGSRQPAEIALAIAAELVAVRSGGERRDRR